MKKLTALGLGTLLGLSTIAAPQTFEKISRTDAVRIAHEAKGKKVTGLNSVRAPHKTSNGLSIHHSTKRLAVNAGQQTRFKSPAMISAESKNLYGALAFYDDPAEAFDLLGYCSINPATGVYTNIIPSEFTITAAGEKDGKLYVNAYSSFWGYIIGGYNIVYDLATGEPVEFEEIDLDFSIEQLFVAGAFDVEEGAFYGATFTNGTDRIFTKYDVATKEYTYYSATVSSEAYTCNQETGEVVGIKSMADGSTYLMNYDKNSGEASVLAEVGYSTDYPGGLCYSPEDGAYIWNPNSDDWSKLVLVSENGSVSEICDLEGYAEFTVLVNTAEKTANPDAPGRAAIESIEFAGADLSGKITIKMPDTKEDDAALTGEVAYTLTCDGESLTTGTAEAGATVVLDVTVGQGMHTFAVTCSLNDVAGRPVSQNAYVGNDTPCAPKNVTLDATTISWDAVTEGVHNGYVDAAAVTYTVTLNGEVIASGIDVTSCPTGLASGTDLNLYVASVVASCNGLSSAATQSNDLVYGDPLPLPVAFEPTPAQSKLFTIIDNNGDEYSWSFYEGSTLPYTFRYTYNSTNDGDDWLILPPVKIGEAGTLHSFAMTNYVQSSSYPERIEVCIGKEATAEAMTRTIIAAMELSNTDPVATEAYFNVEEAGVYYIGVHAISDADSYYLYAADFKVDNTGILSTGPAAATDITATAAAEGALKATVTATLPTATLGGQPIAEGAKVTMTVTSEAGSASVEGNPGETVSAEVATVQGINKLRVQTSTGDEAGMIEYVNVFTGMDAPGALTNMKAESSADNLSAKITWEAPTIGADGGYVAPTGITYYLCENTIFGWSLGDEIGTDVFEYEVSVPADSPQTNMYVAIVGINEAGAGLISSVVVPLGQLYELPAVETFADEEPTYGPITIYNGDVAIKWGVGNPGEVLGEEYMNESGNAIIGYAFDATTGRLSMPRFSAAGADKLALEFSLYCGDIEDVIVRISGYGVDTKEVFRLSDAEYVKDAYNKFSVTLPEAYQNNPWVSMEFEAVLGVYGGYFVLDSYTLRNLVDYDLAVTRVSAPAETAIGATIDVFATVENQGMQPIDYKGGVFSLIDSRGLTVEAKAVEAAATLQPAERVQASAQFAIPAECLGSCTLKFAASVSDENISNNEKSISITVSVGDAVVVTDLDAAWNEEGTAIDLTWSQAAYTPGFESFENNTPFVISSDMIGEFINVDRDGKEVYCWNGANNIPELADMAFKAGAFNVINCDAIADYFSADMSAAEGEQCLIAFCPGDGSASDDWLISPELVAGSSFGFMARPLTLEYGSEVIEIAYSTGSVDPADFELLEKVEVDKEGWTKYEFTLPEGATRFAIRYVAVDIFGIMIDALKYLPKDADAIIGYDVYRAEGSRAAEKIATVEECGYSDATADPSTSNTYYVVPVLASGAEGEKSNVVVVGGLSGIDSFKAARSIFAGRGEIVLKGYAGEMVTISNVSGQAITHDAASDNDRVSVPAGVYLVKSADRVVKIIVK